MGDKKIFAGPRLRRIRRDLGLTQTRMAEELGVSISYLNLIERNQRPLSAQFIIKLAECYDIDFRTFAENDQDLSFAELSEMFQDKLFKDLEIPALELKDMAETCPTAIQGILRLYRNYNDILRSNEATHELINRDQKQQPHQNPFEQVRDYLHAQKNYFETLDLAAEELHDKLLPQSNELFAAMRERLRAKYGVHVRIMPNDVMSESLRRYDIHRKQLLISELLSIQGRTFQTAYQLVQFEFDSIIKDTLKTVSFTSDAARSIAKINFVNYAAAALIMPYNRFYNDTEELGYDIELLGRRYTTSFEQVAHRLTTLQRPGAKGIPFFMVRIDSAGNVSKRFSAGGFHFSRFGGTCPIWNIHATFMNRGEVLTQIIEMPDDTQYFSIARTVSRLSPTFFTAGTKTQLELAVGLGCDIKYADRLVYSKGYDLITPNPAMTGVNCSLCERMNCAMRSSPPLSRDLVIDERSRNLSSYQFSQPS